MQLGAAVVVFAASLPHAIVGHPVGSFHAEHQVLDEGNLQETAEWHLTRAGNVINMFKARHFNQRYPWAHGQ